MEVVPLSFLDYVIFGPVAVKHLLIAVAAIALIIWVAPKLFGKRERPDIYETVRCLECGWAGTVSKYHRTCRKCNSTALDKIG